MSRCPRFTRTQFLGGGIVRYNARLGWGGQGGTGGRSELDVEVVNDTCNGGGVTYSDNGWGGAGSVSVDAFNPPELGKPVEFHFSTFRFGGILQNWKEQDSAKGAKTYICQVVDPSQILVGTQIICKGYSGETFEMANLYNIYGWLEETYGLSCPDFSSTWYPPFGFNAVLRYLPALAFGGAWDRGGLPWFQIYDALTSMAGGAASRFGGLLKYRGEQYYLDLTEMPALDPEIKFSSDSYNLLALITEVCELAQYDFFVELADKNIIKIRTTDRSASGSDGGALSEDQAVDTPIDNRLNIGVVGSNVGSATDAVSKGRGLELRDSYVNAFLTGDFRRDMWQVNFMGGCNPTATIWPYWGKDDAGNVILGTGCADQNMTSEHLFTIWVGDLGLPGLSTWTVSTTELRCAAKDETAWRNFALARQPGLENSLEMVADAIVENTGFIGNALRRGKGKALDTASAARKQAMLAPLFEKYEPIQRLWARIKKYANEYMGRMFMVKLPYLCKKIYADSPYRIHANWEPTDSAWFEGAVLGLMPGSLALENFREDNGEIVGFVGFQSTGAPLDCRAPKDTSVVLNPYLAYVRCHVREIVHGVGGDPTDSRAVIELDGSVYLRNTAPVPEPVLLYYAMAKAAGLNAPTPEIIAYCKKVATDKAWGGLPGLPLLPLAAAVPLQSKTNCYGPWAASVGDNSSLNPSTAGKTDYKKDTTFAPWEFGSMSKMNLCGDITVATQLSDKYVYEQGSIEIADAPSTSLGEVLYAGGPVVSNLNVNFQQGTGAVTTRIILQLYTPRYGRLGTHYVSAIKRAGQAAVAYRRFYMEKALSKFKRWMSAAMSFWAWQYDDIMLRFKGHSTSDFYVGEVIEDVQDMSWGRSSLAVGQFTQIVPTLEAGTSNYVRKAGCEMNGIFRPFSSHPGGVSVKLPSFENAGTPDWDDDYLLKNTMFYSKEQVPPIYCEEHHMPITMETLSPFLKDGTSVNGGQMTWGSSIGHDIEYIVRDGVYPVHLSIRQSGYSADHNYRAIALRGPLIVAGWGFDIDNKPVPNAAPSYPDNPQMAFQDNWLRKPETWKCGPVDLRWDDRRKVWTSPVPFKIVRLKLCGPLLPAQCAHAVMWADDLQYDKNGDILPWQDCCSGPGGSLRGNAKVTVWSTSHRPVPEGFDIMAFYDGYTERYHMIYHDDPLYLVQILTNMNPGDWGLAKILVIGATDADQCGRLVDQTILLENPMVQPLCEGQYAITYLAGIVPTSYETWCDYSCPSGGYQHHVVLQASFRPLCIVTWVSLIECPDRQQDPINCHLEPAGDNSKCYCYFTIKCYPIFDDWVEYDICVKDRQIWLQSAWSQEKAWDYPCDPNQQPGGQARGGSKISDCYRYIRPIDCVGQSASCSAGGEY